MLPITFTCLSAIIITVKRTYHYLAFFFIFYCNQSYSQERTLIYKYKSVDGVLSFSDIQPLDNVYEQVRIGCFACQVDSLIDWHNAILYLTQYQRTIKSAATLYKVNPAFIRAIIHAESHFNAKAVSKQGAQGLMQLMPTTAQALGVKNPFIAKQNIYGGVKHLAHLLKLYQGNNRLAAAAYNAGEGAVKKYSGIPPYEETKVYVERVDILYQRYQRAIKI
ncbi:MAG: lytic transglycosylase domain-containing protein [Colwellia sp.]|nr:lytic transglycosylase domain-containing protein [Colwellia sp.]